MTALRFEEARAEDLPDIIAISAITHREHQERLPEAFPPGVGNEIDGLFRDHFGRPRRGPAHPETRLIVCRDGDRTVGHVFLRVQDVDRQDDRHDIVGTVMDISILPGYRRRGIGTRLIEEARLAMRAIGATRIEAHVWQGNHASATTFVRQGFVPLYRLYMQRLSEPLAGRTGSARTRTRRPGRVLILSLALNLLLILWLVAFLNR